MNIMMVPEMTLIETLKWKVTLNHDHLFQTKQDSQQTVNYGTPAPTTRA